MAAHDDNLARMMEFAAQSGRQLRRLFANGGGLSDAELVGHFIPMYWAIAQRYGVGIDRALFEQAFLDGFHTDGDGADGDQAA